MCSKRNKGEGYRNSLQDLHFSHIIFKPLFPYAAAAATEVKKL